MRALPESAPATPFINGEIQYTGTTSRYAIDPGVESTAARSYDGSLIGTNARLVQRDVLGYSDPPFRRRRER